jgi:hypothetical protein
MYHYKVLVNFEIEAAKYLQILATSKTQSTTKNVYFTIPATICKGLHQLRRLQEHVFVYKNSRLCNFEITCN